MIFYYVVYQNVTMDADYATIVALGALEHIAADDDLLRRFMAETGVEPTTLSEAAAEPAFLAGVLDFLLSDEPALLAYCEAASLAPELPMRARRALPGSPMED
jgi:hypothetical protein